MCTELEMFQFNEMLMINEESCELRHALTGREQTEIFKTIMMKVRGDIIQIQTQGSEAISF